MLQQRSPRAFFFFSVSNLPGPEPLLYPASHITGITQQDLHIDDKASNGSLRSWTDVPGLIPTLTSRQTPPHHSLLPRFARVILRNPPLAPLGSPWLPCSLLLGRFRVAKTRELDSFPKYGGTFFPTCLHTSLRRESVVIYEALTRLGFNAYPLYDTPENFYMH